MALSKKPVNGMKDILPREMEIRDYVTNVIKTTYREFGFTPIETPCMENIANLSNKQGGENEKLIFKVMKKTMWWTLVCVMILLCHFADSILIMPMICQVLLRHCRSVMYGVQTAHREADIASLPSAILIF